MDHYEPLGSAMQHFHMLHRYIPVAKCYGVLRSAHKLSQDNKLYSARSEMPIGTSPGFPDVPTPQVETYHVQSRYVHVFLGLHDDVEFSVRPS
jgi:hypothetical protein